MAKNGRCPAGQYYCYTDKKCKPIPKGFKTVGPAGMLRKENGHSVDDNNSDTKKNGNGNGNGGNGNGGTVSEEGLRDWFGKSKSKDGKPGWVQSDGSPCANEPGEKGTPKCYSSAKKASMSKKELRSADTRKSRQDPGQQQKSGAAKPTYVSTDKPKKKMKEETILEKDMIDKQGNDKFDRHKRMIRHKQDKYGRASVMDKIKTGKDYKEETFNEAEDKKTKGSGTKDACYTKVKSRYSVWPSAYASGALVKCRKVGAANWGNSTKKEEFEGFYDLPAFTESQIAAMKYAGIEVEVIDEACWKGYEKKGMKTMFGKRYPNCVKKEEVESVDEGKYSSSVRATYGGKTETFPVEIYKKKSKKAEIKKEEVEVVDEGLVPLAVGALKVAGNVAKSPLVRKAVVGGVSRMVAGGAGSDTKRDQKEEVEKVDEACWDTHEQRGMKKKGGKMVPNCVPKGSMKKEEVTGGILVQDAGDFKPREIESVDIIKADPIKGGQLQELVRTKIQTGNMYQVIFGWRGKMMMVKLFFPDASIPNRQKVADALNKMYPGSQLRSYSHSIVDYDDPYINVGEETNYNEIEEDMTGMSQKSGDKRSTKSGAGMTAKGVAKYNRRTGGNLKTAVTTPPSKLKPGSKAAGRRKSFCARSKSWKGERGLAARRRWNC